MAETLLSIQEAAAISGKSIQTIRRAIKNNKLTAKKRKTAQGFNYMVTQDSLTTFYKINPTLFDRQQSSIKEKESTTAISNEVATQKDLQMLQQSLEHMLDDYKKEKDNLMRFMKAFQDKFVALENRYKLLEEPKKKAWYQFWK